MSSWNSIFLKSINVTYGLEETYRKESLGLKKHKYEIKTSMVLHVGTKVVLEGNPTTTVAITKNIVVVIHLPSEIVAIQNFVGLLEINLHEGAGSICIQNIHHSYIFLLPLWHNKVSICGNEHHYIVRIFYVKDAKTNAFKFPKKECLCAYLIVSHYEFDCFTID